MSVCTVGIDLAKLVLQVRGVDDAGRPMLKKRLAAPSCGPSWPGSLLA